MSRAMTVYVFIGWQLFDDTSLKPLLMNKIAFGLKFVLFVLLLFVCIFHI